MKRWFVDSFYYVGLLNAQDQHHREVMEFSAKLTGRTITTDAVFLEVANSLAGTILREKAADLIRSERTSRDLRIVRLTPSLLERGLDLYESRKDKRWSLTDCISFIVMEDEGLTDALTGDHHFEQAGFHAVFAP